MKKARNIHAQAEEAREGGNFTKALKLADKATVTYQEEDDHLGMAEVQGSRFLILRHLYFSTGDEGYFILAKHAAESSIEIAELVGDESALAIPHHNLGKLLDMEGNCSEAVVHYKKAISILKSNPPKEQGDVSGYIHEVETHLAISEYRNGDRTALERLQIAIDGVQEKEKRGFERDVWVSGGYIEMADMLKDDDVDMAKEALDKAKEIIDANKDLSLLAKKWKELAASFK